MIILIKGLILKKINFMKKVLLLWFAAIAAMSVVMSCKEDVQIIFGTDLNPKNQMRKSAMTADTAELKVLQTWDDGRDIRYSYYFEEAISFFHPSQKEHKL